MESIGKIEEMQSDMEGPWILQIGEVMHSSTSLVLLLTRMIINIIIMLIVGVTRNIS